MLQITSIMDLMSLLGRHIVPNRPISATSLILPKSWLYLRQGDYSNGQMMTGMPPDMQAMMAQFPMTPDMMFGGMGMMPDPTAFVQPGFGGSFGQPTGPQAGQQNFSGGYGGFPQQSHQQQPGYNQQFGQQSSQLQPPKFPSQRPGSPARTGSPNMYFFVW
jgi:hypothetical protein